MARVARIRGSAGLAKAAGRSWQQTPGRLSLAEQEPLTKTRCLLNVHKLLNIAAILAITALMGFTQGAPKPQKSNRIICTPPPAHLRKMVKPHYPPDALKRQVKGPV